MVCLIEVIEVTAQTSKSGEYMRVRALQEVGFWMETFYFNMFPNHPLYEKLTVGLKMKVQVTFTLDAEGRGVL